MTSSLNWLCNAAIFSLTRRGIYFVRTAYRYIAARGDEPRANRQRREKELKKWLIADADAALPGNVWAGITYLRRSTSRN
jgi:predicted alpha/beta-hydrolase family hydrolase